MYETGEDLRALQELLDASYARAGSHLRSIWGQETRLDAQELSAELTAAQVLDLATVTPRGEPRVAPVDGLFFRGRFWFGSAELRFRGNRSLDNRPPGSSSRLQAGVGPRPVRVECRSRHRARWATGKSEKGVLADRAQKRY